jgi:rod shape-determining protein MreD
MHDILHGALTLLGAVLIHALVGPWLAASMFGLNVFPIAVILFAMVKGDLAGAVLGTAAGAAADAFSLGVFGINGVVYTAIGFLSGWVSRRINVSAFGRSILFIGLLSGLELALRLSLSAAVIGEHVPWNRGWLLLQPPAAALAGASAFALFRRIRRAHAR